MICQRLRILPRFDHTYSNNYVVFLLKLNFVENFHLHFDEFLMRASSSFQNTQTKIVKSLLVIFFSFFLFNIGEEVLGFSISDEGRIFVAPQIEPGDKGCNEVLAFKYDDGKGNNDGM